MKKRTFFAAKINIHANIFSHDLSDLISIHIPRVIKSGPIKVNTYTWSITDINESELDGRKIITGNVTKSKYKNQKIRINKETKTVVSDYELADTAFFVYDVNNEILVHESTSSIHHNDFRNFFTEFLGRDNLVGEVKIFPIPVPFAIRTELKSIEIITQISFHLIHPNPGKDEFNLYNNIIEKLNLKEVDIKMVNEEGITITEKVELSEEFLDTNIKYGEEDKNLSSVIPEETHEVDGDEKLTSFINHGILLVEAGYGNVEFKGFDNILTKDKRGRKITKKHKRKFSSKNSIRKLNVDDEDQPKLLLKLIKFIMDVKDKLKE